MVRGGPEDAELSHGRRGVEGTAARAIPGRQPPPPAIAPAATTSTSTPTPTSPPPQQEVHRAKTVIGPVLNPGYHVTWPHNQTRLTFAQSPPPISTKAGWLMSAVIVANETPSKESLGGTITLARLRWRCQWRPTHQPEPRRDGLHGINASAFGIPLGLSVLIGYPSLHFRPAQSIFPPPPPSPIHFSAAT
jgi:hypothetical protein